MKKQRKKNCYKKKTKSKHRFKSKLQVEQCGSQYTHAFIESLNPSYIIHQHIVSICALKIVQFNACSPPIQSDVPILRVFLLIILASSLFSGRCVCAQAQQVSATRIDSVIKNRMIFSTFLGLYIVITVSPSI